MDKHLVPDARHQHVESGSAPAPVLLHLRHQSMSTGRRSLVAMRIAPYELHWIIIPLAAKVMRTLESVPTRQRRLSSNASSLRQTSLVSQATEHLRRADTAEL